ncbi:MAG: hypothetical protein ACLQE9_02150 [Roseiarcus sp.]
MRVWPVIVVFVAAGVSHAEAQQRVDPTAFGQNPARYLNQSVRLNGLGCWSADGAVRCTSYKGVYIAADAVAPAAIKDKISQDCGGIVEAESDPACTFDVILTPTALSRGPGSIVKGDQAVDAQVWIVRAALVAATAHR